MGAGLTGAGLTELTAATFDEVVAGSDRPVVVEVWAEWCPPCRALAPVVEEIAAAHRDRVAFYGLNSDEHPEVSARFGVMGVPTLLVFEDGELVQRLVGARGKGRLLEELADYL